MKKLTKDALEQGALGLSSGLFCAPGSFADTKELVERSTSLTAKDFRAQKTG